MSLREEGAASALVGLLIAVGVFSLTFAVLMRSSVQPEAAATVAEVAGHEATASVLARALLRDAGQGWYEGNACTGGVIDPMGFRPDAVERVGLGEERCAAGDRSVYHRLSYDKLSNLMRAHLEADPDNGALDYEEARASLDLDGTTTDFHLRTWPLLVPLERRVGMAMRDVNLEALYIGDYDEQQGAHAGAFLVQHVAGAVDAGNALLLYVDVTNNGTKATAFTVTFTVPTERSIIVERHTGSVAPGAHQNVTLMLNKTSDWAWKNASDPHFEYSIRDPSKTVGEGRRSLAAFPMTIALTRSTLLLEAAQLEYKLAGGSAKLGFVYDAVKGDGDSNVANPGWTLRLLDGAGAVVATATDLKEKGGTESFTVTTADTYRAQLLTDLGIVAQADYVNVVASPLDRFEPSASGQWRSGPAVLPEATYLSTLLAGFVTGVPDATYADADIGFAADGDVLPDDNRLLSDRLPLLLLNATGAGTLENYNVLVVGSDVDHNTLTSSNVKFPVRDWVEAGGTLVVLGSSEQAVQWLEPLFHTGLQLAGGGIGVPDPDHAVLTTPNQLDVVALDDHGRAWKFKRDEERALFTHVVTKGDQDVLGVSNPGAFGLGRVVLTSWQAFDATLGDPQPECQAAAVTDDCAGLQILDNFVTIAYGPLYVDYGPMPPEGRAVATAADIGIVYAPTFAASLEVYLVLYVWS